MIYLETERLLLRGWKEEDITEFRLLNKDPRVMRYFPKTLTEQETDSVYKMIEEEFSNFGYGPYVVETKANHEFIGILGFHRATFEAPFTPCVEILWRLKYEAWGKGYATEGAKACLKYGFDTLGFEKVYSMAVKDNFPSQNVMQKIGMEKVMEFKHPNIDETSPLAQFVLYSLESYRR
jgi:ribosomal-protein-alanine N-acetyltransferase